MMKKWNNKFIIAVSSIVIVLTLIVGGVSYYFINLKAVSNKTENVSFQIQQGDTSSTIITRLKENNLIRNVMVTKLYVKLQGKNELKAGAFTIDRAWDVAKIFDTLSDSKQAKGKGNTITFREGLWAKDIAKLIEEKLGIAKEELLTLWNDETYIKELMKQYPFLTNKVLNKDYKVKLEGFLFPDTYTFKEKATPKEITTTFLNQFQVIYKKYEQDIKKNKLDIQEMITLASMVQYEASKKQDMDMIAGVFYNRLEKNMSLDSSVTVCYALYDKMKSQDDCELNTQIQSPYNTYIHKGLPIGPILNPGEAAIQAVLNPKKNDYLYFVADIYGDGTVYYSKTLKEQEANIDKFNLRK